jgi:triacylglycerol lipase
MRALAVLVAILLLSSTTLGFAAEPGPTADAADNRECVVVLHGLARSSRSMSRLVERLSDAGFLVDSLDYPSTREPFDELVAGLTGAVEHDSATCPKIHFVGYSLGALLVRAYLQRTHPKGLGRVVMIAPPNHGSEIVWRRSSKSAGCRSWRARGSAGFVRRGGGAGVILELLKR